MILIISTCEEKIHEMEFVNPIENILKNKKISFFRKHYKEINEKDLKNADKIIMTGTSLKDNKFLKDINYFEWIKSIKKPILGICSGMQIILLIYNGKLRNKKEIGYYKENFTKEFLGMKGENEVYHLHNNYITLPKDFISYTKGKVPQAVKHKEKEIYGVLFHPEVRKSNLIEEFVRI
jgi:GMP synthase-like glutamine amidotransferase